MDLEWNPNRREMIASALGIPIPIDPLEPEKIPVLNRILILALLLLFVASLLHLIKPELYSFTPSHAFNQRGLTWFSSFFIHAGFYHLFGNIYFLSIFGNLAEKSMKRLKYLLLIFSSILAGNLMVYLFSPQADLPHLGASGGIMGVMTYVLLSFPKQYYGIFFFGSFIKVPAIALMGVYLVYQIFGVTFELHAHSNVSFLSHLGGIVMGLLFWEMTQLRVHNKGFVGTV